MEITICSKPLFTGETVRFAEEGRNAALRWTMAPYAPAGAAAAELGGSFLEDLLLAERILAPTEIARYRSLFRNPRRQRELLHTRLLAKRLIRDYVEERRGWHVGHERDIALLQVERGDRQGMPYISIGKDRASQGLSVSLAHGGRMLGAAVGERCLVGIDIEQIRPVEEGLPGLFLVPEERQWMSEVFRRYAADEWCLLMWSLKEAAGKALGTGFSRGFSSLRFHALENGEGACRVRLELNGGLERYAPRPRPRGVMYYDVRDGVCGVVCLLFSAQQGGSRD
ncbi:4'-phosphopantetheinyl transferase superfamily protein [Paenibacillus oralis]|uniref:4'-phosphopantetheinyl transferase superfamily protein n=1 Tax=Paenibacillus oralis TaxID=2490856 RepID=A0A3P3U6K5_9BACL|nr:4'-phosphopantetheinyl transferase superfamily protein [Paenibacillus oralis]RRJ66001.1 4'-phosphopantetheinyl transferase superfamily protein [Paenibacillus oralis]